MEYRRDKLRSYALGKGLPPKKATILIGMTDMQRQWSAQLLQKDIRRRVRCENRASCAANPNFSFTRTWPSKEIES